MFIQDAVHGEAYKHAVVPLGVIVGLGVAHIVSSIARYFQAKDRILFSWAVGAWCLVLFFWLVGIWWVAWGMRYLGTERLTYFALIFLMIGPGLVYMAAALLLPALPSEGKLDVEKRLHESARPFFGCLIASVVWAGAIGVWFLDEPFLALPRLGQGIAVVVFTIGLTHPTRRTVRMLGLVMLLLLTVQLATFRPSLQ